MTVTTTMRTRKAFLAVNTETVQGTYNAPDPATQGILIENPRPAPSVNVQKTDESSQTLDGFGSIIPGMTFKLEFDVYMHGHGTAGVAPEYDLLMQACGWASIVTAAGIPAAPEALAVGGSTTTALLGASAAATAELYQGMPIVFTGAQAGPSFIADYAAGKLATLTDTFPAAFAATSNYQIPPNVLYAPGSNDIPTLSMDLYWDGLLYSLVGGQGDMSFSVDSNQAGKFTFSFSVLLRSKTDAALPAASYPDNGIRPPVWRGGAMLMGGLTAAVKTLSFKSNNHIEFPEDPNQPDGYGAAQITMRDIGGSVDPLEVLTATRNILADFRSGTERIIHARWGTNAGNRIGVTYPRAAYLNETPKDRSGLRAVDVPFEGRGQDSGAFICIY